MDPVAARFFDAAEQLGLHTDRQIADELGLSVSTVWRLRQGQRGVGLELRRRILANPRFGRFSRGYLFPDEEPGRVAI